MYPITLMCRLLGVSPSGFYAWRQRSPSLRAQANEPLLTSIRAIHERSQGTYGAPRIHAELGAQGIRVSRKRVEHRANPPFNLSPIAIPDLHIQPDKRGW